MQIQKHEMSEFPHYGTSMGKKANSQVSLYHTYLELVEAHGIPYGWKNILFPGYKKKKG